MRIICVKCRKKFDQKHFERTCGCTMMHYKSEHREFNIYFANLKQYFQNPRYQAIRLQHDENISYEMHSLPAKEKLKASVRLPKRLPVLVLP